MGNRVPEMVDVVFDLRGSFVPEGYVFGLWNEVMRILPWLDAEELAGILPLRGATSGEVMLLAKRAKLVLRLPADKSAQAKLLSGQELKVGSGSLQVGEGNPRPLQPYATLHAHIVESDENEERFLVGVAAGLQDMGISCKWICGRHITTKAAGQSLSGYSLVLHDLKPGDSLQIQRTGLGGKRRFGCGIFIPYKDISGLE